MASRTNSNVARLPIEPAAARLDTAQARFDLLLRLAASSELDCQASMAAHEWLQFARQYMAEHPEPGMHLTFTVYTDRHPYVITYVSPSKKTIRARMLRPKRVDTRGWSESQQYVFVDNLADKTELTLTRRARRGGQVVWKATGQATRQRGNFAVLGVLDAYYDYSF